MGKFKTRIDGTPAQIGQKYMEKDAAYPYGTKRHASGADLPAQTRSVDSMKSMSIPENQYQVQLSELNHTYLDGHISQEQYEKARTIMTNHWLIHHQVLTSEQAIGEALITSGYSANPDMDSAHAWYEVSRDPEWKEGDPTKHITDIDVPETKKITITKVKIHRAEGFTGDPTVGKWMEFDSLEAANKQLTENAKGMPSEQLGYDKHDFIVEFSDGSRYEGRYDLHRQEQGDIGKQMTEFSGFVASKKGKKFFPHIDEEHRKNAAHIHKIMTQNQKPKAKPESLESLQKRELEYWKGMNEAIAHGKNQGRDEYEMRAEYARAHGQKRDLSPMIYRTTIGHYGGLYVEVPEEKFDDFKALFPTKEFPRKVEHNDLHDAAAYHPEAAQHFHKVFPGYSGKTRTVYFANASKGEKRLDYYDLPHERETNPANPGALGFIGSAIGKAVVGGAKTVGAAVGAARTAGRALGAARAGYETERYGKPKARAKPKPEPVNDYENDNGTENPAPTFEEQERMERETKRRRMFTRYELGTRA